MSEKHKVIIIPGLGNPVAPIKWATRHWHSYGLEPTTEHLFSIGMSLTLFSKPIIKFLKSS